MSLLDLIFPKKCISCKRFGDFLCADCFSMISYNQSFQCPACLRPSVNGLTHPKCETARLIDGIIPAVVYRGVIKRIVYQLKYKPYLKAIGKTIGEIMNEGLSQNESFYYFISQYKPVVIPIPLHKARERERGYNHAGIMAYYVAQYFKLVVSDKLLVRVKDTKVQYKLNKEARIKNLVGAFGIRESASRRTEIPRSVVLVDDVATTFATLKEAAKVLKSSGAKKVLGVTFAREI